MIRQFLQFIASSWLKWIFIGLFLALITIIGYGTYIYQTIEDTRQSGFDESEARAVEETDIELVNEVIRFHGELYYHVIRGETNMGESAIAYVPVEATDEPIQFFLTNDLISQEIALENWKQRCSSCDLRGIKPAIEKEQPLWEIKYINNKDRYVYQYISMTDGENYSTIPLKRSTY